MTISKLAEYFQKLEHTSSRLDMTETLAELFAVTSTNEIAQVVNFSLGQLRPKYDRLEFNMSIKMVLKSMAYIESRLTLADFEKQYKELGDIGDLAQKYIERQINQGSQTSSLTVKEVFEELIYVAELSGTDSQLKKIQRLANLFTGVDNLSRKYIARMVVGKLRLGFSDMTILDALSWMKRGDKSGRKQLENAYQLKPDIGEIARLSKQYNIEEVSERIEIEVGVPIIPALAQRLKTADEMIKKMGPVLVDPKYDGTRVQIHFRAQGLGARDQWEVKTFTRNLDESSVMFPELDQIGQYLNAQEVILDSEAIGYDPETGSLLPFQMTIQRKRKHGITEAAKEIPLKFFVFDILYKDGQSLLTMPLSERIKILEETIVDGPVLEKTEFIQADDSETIRKHHADLLAQGLEGAMVKKREGIYNPGRKGWTWVKFKESETSAAKLSDTIDAVVIGLYAGRGKRAAFGVGAFLIAIRDDQDKLVTISKVGTGLSDEQWRELKQRSEESEINQKNKNYFVHKDLEPDIWLNPEIVVEVAADEITKSPNHTAGYALRFPRLVKFRDDKDVEQVTTLAELKTIS